MRNNQFFGEKWILIKIYVFSCTQAGDKGSRGDRPIFCNGDGAEEIFLILRQSGVTGFDLIFPGPA